MTINRSSIMQRFTAAAATCLTMLLVGNPLAANPSVATLNSVDQIVGLRETGGQALGYYVNANADLVGNTGTSGSRYGANLVLGYTLPTLPAGTTVDAATLKFEITANRDQSNQNPSVQVHMLDVVDPSSSGVTYFFNGPSDGNAASAKLGSTYIDVGTSEVAYADDLCDQAYVLSGNALNWVKAYYGGDHVPDRAEVFFRFSLDIPVSSLTYLDRYRIDLAVAESALEITSIAPDTTPPALVASHIVDDAGGGPVPSGAGVTYTVTFSEDIDETTVDEAEFGNAGTSSISIGTITEPSPGVFSVPVTATGAGTLQLRVNAAAVITDVAGNALDTASAIVDDTTIEVTNINLPPEWAGPSILGADATENSSYSGTLANHASDPNHDVLAFAKVSGRAWLIVGTNGTLSGTPGPADLGTNVFTVSVSDNTAPAVEATLTIEVLSSGAWRSTLYPANWSPPDATASFYNDKLIQDFSYAGYQRGEAPVPTITGPVYDVTDPSYGADPTGAVDSTVAIQSAINAAGSAGGGVVFIPAGTYKISPQGSNAYCLRISQSHVVLRGAGAASTFLLNTSTSMRSKSVIDARGTITTGSAVSITADLPGPTRRIPVATPASFAVGDVVRLEWTFTDAWVAEHGQQSYWNATDGYPVNAEYLREVVAVDVAAGWIEVDVPTRYAMKTRDAALVRKITGMVSNIGIESLAVGNVQHPGSGWGENDYNVAGTAAYDVNGSFVVKLANLRDGWVTGVKSFLPAGNTSTCHMLSNGIAINDSTRVAIKDCWMGRPQYGGGGGNGYMYRLQNAYECLLQSCSADLARHGFVISHAGTSGNVFLQCEDRVTARALGGTTNGTGYTTGGSGSDNHMHFSHSNLWDRCHAHDSFYTAHHRTTSGTIPHALTSAHGVYWNTTGSGTRYTNIVVSEQGRYGYVIGTSGSKSGISTPSGTTNNTVPTDHAEGGGAGAMLSPASLYLDQLSRRIQPAVTYLANGATGGTVPFDTNSPYASGATVTVSSAGTMTWPGYTFAGWNTAANGSGTPYTPGNTFTIDNHVTLYAQWNPITFTVSLDSQGGTGGSSSVSAVFGAAMPVATAPTRSGYAFGGYYTEINGGGTQYYTAAIASARNWDMASNTTLHAKWTLASYTVTYAANGATGGDVPVDGNNPYAGGATVTVLGNTGSLVRTGYVFAGWNAAAHGGGQNYLAGDTFTISADTTLYAKWTPNSYTVNFDANGGTAASPISISASFGSPYGTLATTSRDGYSFTGWFSAASGGTKVTSATTVATATDHTLYAQWNALPTADAGTDQMVSIGTSIPWTPAAIAKEVWFDAADTSTIYNATSGGSAVADNGAVARWEDKSGNSRHAIQSTSGFRPLLRLNALNGLPTMDFDGADDLLNVGGTAFSTQNLFVVFNSEAGATFNGWHWVFGSMGTPDVPALYASSGTTNIGSNLPDKNNSSNTRYVNGTVGSNLATLSTFDIVQASGSTASPSRSNWLIGDGDANWNGRFAELIVMSGVVSTDDRLRMEGYLAHKWRLTASLPQGHRYEELPPGIATASANLAGGASDAENDSLGYSWSVVSGPTGSTITNGSTLSPTVTFTQSGTYTLRLTVSDANGSSSDDVVITVKSTPTVTTWPTAGQLTEGQALASATLSGGSASVPGTFSFDNPSTVPAIGTSSHAVTFTPADGDNYFSVGGTVNVTVLSAFDGWVNAHDGSGVTFSGDSNNDGVADGVAWLLGSASPNESARPLMPPVTESSGALSLDFTYLKPSPRGSAVLKLQYSRDLGGSDLWASHTVTVPDVSSTVGGVVFVITPVDGQELQQVQATIPVDAAGGGPSLFARLVGEVPAP